jgi:branched-chain amino acid transport system substrate-binding protein
MSARIDRRTFLVGTAGAALVATAPAPARAQQKPVRIGLLTVKTGPLAQGGIQMEQGITRFLKDRNYTLAGRKVELVVADTGGNPAGTKTKTQELVERDNVDLIVGPLAAFELLAITDYAAQAKMPILSLAAAEDMTQRRPNPYFVRASATSAQSMHPLADYAAKELKLKRVITISEDFAFGYEQMGGFQRVFEDAGGRVVKKLWPPLVTPDYTPYLAQISGVDALVQGFAGSNPLKFMKQYRDQGLKLPVLSGSVGCDDALLKSFGEEAIGVVSCSAYSSELDTPSNKRLVEGMVRDHGNIPGIYAAGLYINGMVAEAALEKTGGKTDDKDALIKALRSVSLTDTPRGPFHFDHFGNVVGNFYIRRCEKRGDKLVNTIIKTYPNVSQFWTYEEKWFLSQPVYSRDYPPLKS